MEQRLDRKGWGRGDWKTEGQPQPWGHSRLPKTPAEGQTPQKTEIMGLSINKWLFPQRHPAPGASGQSFPALFWIRLLHQLLVLSVWALSVSISQSQPEVPISDGPRSGMLLLTEQFSMQTDWCFPRLGLNLPWAPPKWPLCFLFILASIFPLMGHFEISLIICGLYTPHIDPVALTFPTREFLGPDLTILHFFSPPRVSLHAGIFPCFDPNK